MGDMKSDMCLFIKCNLSALLLLVLFSSGMAQQKEPLEVKPGSNLIDGSFIKDYTNKWEVYFVDAQGNEVLNRVWTDYGQIMELDGVAYLHRVQDLYAPNMNLADTWINMVEHISLKPQKFYSIQPTGIMSYFSFYDDSVTYRTNATSQDLSFSAGTHELSEPVFDWNLYGFLLVGLPFDDGAVYSMPFYNNQTGQINKLIATIAEQETIITLSGKKVQTTKVNTNQNLVFWLSKEAPYVLTLELTLPNGKLVWKPE